MVTKKYKTYVFIYYIMSFSLFSLAGARVFYELKNDNNYLLLGVLIWLFFTGLYLVRYFFRPPYQDVVKLFKNGMPINFYYSEKALVTEQKFLNCYDYWIKTSLLTLLVELLLFIALAFLFASKVNFSVLIVHTVAIFLSQFVPYSITAKKESEL